MIASATDDSITQQMSIQQEARIITADIVTKENVHAIPTLSCQFQ